MRYYESGIVTSTDCPCTGDVNQKTLIVASDPNHKTTVQRTIKETVTVPSDDPEKPDLTREEDRVISEDIDTPYWRV